MLRMIFRFRFFNHNELKKPNKKAQRNFLIYLNSILFKFNPTNAVCTAPSLLSEQFHANCTRTCQMPGECFQIWGNQTDERRLKS
jgi:hypothetical protein